MSKLKTLKLKRGLPLEPIANELKTSISYLRELDIEKVKEIAKWKNIKVITFLEENEENEKT